MVEYVLKNHPKSRDSDQWLTIKIWTTFFESKIHIDTNGKYVYLNDMLDLPREDNVKRIRATFQNDKGMYLPTSIEVVRRRKQNEAKWRELTNTEYKRI